MTISGSGQRPWTRCWFHLLWPPSFWEMPKKAPIAGSCQQRMQSGGCKQRAKFRSDSLRFFGSWTIRLSKCIRRFQLFIFSTQLVWVQNWHVFLTRFTLTPFLASFHAATAAPPGGGEGWGECATFQTDSLTNKCRRKKKDKIKPWTENLPLGQVEALCWGTVLFQRDYGATRVAKIPSGLEAFEAKVSQVTNTYGGVGVWGGLHSAHSISERGLKMHTYFHRNNVETGKQQQWGD